MNVSATRRCLEHDGEPFFYLADTAWKLLTVPAEAEAGEYLRTRQAQGFTVIMPVIATERIRGEEGEPSALLDDDPSRPDERYFARVDRIVGAAEALGLWLALLPAWGSYVGGGASDRPIFDEASARRYGAYLGRRYRDRNVIWVNGGDRRVSDDRVKAIWRALAAGLREGDGGQHLITFHPAGLRPDPRFSGSSGLWFHDDDWLDYNMLQTGSRFLEEDLCARYLAEYTRQPTKPFVDGETRYENSHRNFAMPRPSGPKITAHHVRQAAHYAMLCGALGHTYGCRDVWSFYVPSDRPPARCVDTHWQEAIHFPGARQLIHWRRLFERYPWYRLSPDLPTITSTLGPAGAGAPRRALAGSGAAGTTGGGAGTPAVQAIDVAMGAAPAGEALVTHGAWDGSGNIRTPAAIADDRSFALVYLPLPMPVWIDLSRLAGDAVDALWHDPRTGQERLIRRYHDKATIRFFPPGDETEPDWVLILRRA